MRLLPIGDLVPAERTMLIRFYPRSVECDAVAAWVHRAMSTAAPAGRPSGPDVAGPDVAGPDLAGPDLAGPDVAGPDVAVRVIVRYDGDDLDDVGRLTGLGPAGVIAVHTGTVWTVAFTGFAPGFGYLVGGDPGCGCPGCPSRGYAWTGPPRGWSRRGGRSGRAAPGQPAGGQP